MLCCVSFDYRGISVALKCMCVTWRYFSPCNVVLAIFLAVDVKTDDRAKMSVAAKMSLFKVGETRAHRISLATAAA